MESTVIIRCLERDVKLVESILGKAKREYTAECKKTLDQELHCELSVDKEIFMKERKLYESLVDTPFWQADKAAEAISDRNLHDKVYLKKDLDN